MKTKLLLLFLMFTLAVTSCSPDKAEPIKTCGLITSMSMTTDALNVNHYYLEIRESDKGVPTNKYDDYEIPQSEYDRIFPTFINNTNNSISTNDCTVTIKLVASRTTD